MKQIVRERECRGKYYVRELDGGKGGYQEFEKGVSLGFSIDYEEFESGPGRYTTAIVELKDGNVTTTLPKFIQFINAKRIGKLTEEKTDRPLLAPVGAVGCLDDEIPSDGKKEPQRDKERAKGGTKKKPGQKRIDHRKIRALKNARWSNQEIAEEMHMTPNGVSNFLSTQKELIEELKKIWYAGYAVEN